MGTQAIYIETSIIQRVGLSPLLFYMAFIPISHELQEAPKGYKLPWDQKLEHIFMDDWSTRLPGTTTTHPDSKECQPWRKYGPRYREMPQNYSKIVQTEIIINSVTYNLKWLMDFTNT